MNESVCCESNGCISQGCNTSRQEQESPPVEKTRCGKCGTADPVILLRGRNVYCRSCFLTASTHKFRAALGKHKIIRKGDALLIGHSGKPNSTALLHLVKRATEESNYKKLLIEPKVLFIDDGVARGQTEEERRTTIEAISAQVNNMNLLGYRISLSMCLRPFSDLSEETLTKLSSAIWNDTKNDGLHEDQLLTKILRGLPDQTARDEFIRRVKRNLLVSVSRLLNCGKILVADTSTDLAIKILADTATGRAATLSSEVAFLDERYSPAVTLLRPMREFTEDEINSYLKEYALTSVFSAGNRREQKLADSVRTVTSNFVRGLDAAFHGTVAAIYRTGDKLVASGSGDNDDDSAINRLSNPNCILCSSKLKSVSETERTESLPILLSAVQATIFSKDVSSVTSEACDSPVTLPSPSRPISENYPQDNLCYGCKTVFRGAKDYALEHLLSMKIQNHLL